MAVTQGIIAPFTPTGPRLIDAVSLNRHLGEGSLNYQDGIVALAGGGATGAAPLYLGMNRIATVASANDSVVLPQSQAGLVVIVQNSGANSAQVFANTVSSLQAGTLDTINGTAGATGVAVANGKMAIFCCFTTGAWVGPVALA